MTMSGHRGCGAVGVWVCGWCCDAGWRILDCPALGPTCNMQEVTGNARAAVEVGCASLFYTAVAACHMKSAGGALGGECRAGGRWTVDDALTRPELKQTRHWVINEHNKWRRVGPAEFIRLQDNAM